MLIEQFHISKHMDVKELFPVETPSLETFIGWAEETSLKKALEKLESWSPYNYFYATWSKFATTTRKEWLEWHLENNKKEAKKIRKLAEDNYVHFQELESMQKRLEELVDVR